MRDDWPGEAEAMRIQNARPAAFTMMLQRRAARVAVGASTVRGQGHGVVSAAREFLPRVDLRPFGTTSEKRFVTALNKSTAAMLAALPRGAASWGLARKLVNIYLRDCMYTWHLRERYGLAAAKPFFEVPLDKVTASGLRNEVRGLPRWPGVKHADPNLSAAYQLAASELARQHGFERVHLDALLWGGRTTKKPR